MKQLEGNGEFICYCTGKLPEDLHERKHVGDVKTTYSKGHWQCQRKSQNGNWEK